MNKCLRMSLFRRRGGFDHRVKPLRFLHPPRRNLIAFFPSMSSESPAALDSTSKPVSFEFVKELSPGGIASTWLARHSADRSDAPSVRLAEVLLLNSHLTEKPELKSGLRRDVEQAKRLRHPNVIAIESATSEGN